MIANATKFKRGAMAVSYARFSDPQQGAGHSIERQEEYAPLFCEEHGLTLNPNLCFRDEGKSAFHGRHRDSRGSFRRLLNCIESGEIREGDVIVIENMDRASRMPIHETEQMILPILQQGVIIHTRSPWAIYDRRALNDPMQRMQLMMEFSRANRESAYKQERLSRRWERNRANIKAGDYKLSLLPGWLKPKRDGKKVIGYEVDKQHAATIRRIFKMCIDGVGQTTIAKRLNADNVPTMGRSTHWAKSSVMKIIHNRAVLGEYQPHTSVRYEATARAYESTRRVPTGDPIRDHYPRIIDDATYNAAQLACHQRENIKSGSGEAKVTNLFSGLLIDARDGSTMHVIDKGDGPRLVSTSSQVQEQTMVSVPYDAFEHAFVLFAADMPLKACFPKQSKAIDAQITKLRKEIDALALQIEQLKEKTRKNASDVLLDLLVERDNERKAKLDQLEILERQAGSSASVAAKSTKSMLTTLQSATGDELLGLRTRLRSELRHWIRRITILPIVVSGVRCAMVDVELQQSGKHLQFRVSKELVNWPPELNNANVCDFTKWPKEIRHTDWETLQPIDEQLLTYPESAPIALIASEVGLSITDVSRRLIKLGRRRRPRKTADSEQLMTWSAPACGWLKRHDGQRYYVGIGTLRKLYPKLVKDSTKEGSMKAANKWWTEHKPKG